MLFAGGQEALEIEWSAPFFGFAASCFGRTGELVILGSAMLSDCPHSELM